MRPSKALVVYDDLEAGKIWGYSLEQLGLQVALATITEDIPSKWRETLPDLFLFTDFNAKSEELALCRDLRGLTPVPILLLTNKTGLELQLEAYRAGVDECIVQPIEPRLFLAKVRAWMRRGRSLPYSAVEGVRAGGHLLEMELRRLCLPDGTSVSLTHLEARLLFVLMSRPGMAVDSASLVKRIWGQYAGGDTTLLKNVVYRLRRKIEPDPANPVHLLQESKLGYRFLPA